MNFQPMNPDFKLKGHSETESLEYAAVAGLLQLDAGVEESAPDNKNSCSSIDAIHLIAEKSRSRKAMHFPTILFGMLEDSNNSDSIHWIDAGRAFIISDKRRFEAEILPRYFHQKESQFSSFTRKLIRWGFRRVSSGKYIGCYYNEKFLRYAPDLCRFITCDHKNNKNPPCDASSKIPPSRSSPPIIPSGSFSTAEDLSHDEIIPKQSLTSRSIGSIPAPHPTTSLDMNLHNQHMQQQSLKDLLATEVNVLQAQQLQQAIKLQKEQELLRLEVEKQKHEVMIQQRARLLLLAQQRQRSRRNAIATRAVRMASSLAHNDLRNHHNSL